MYSVQSSIFMLEVRTLFHVTDLTIPSATNLTFSSTTDLTIPTTDPTIPSVTNLTFSSTTDHAIPINHLPRSAVSAYSPSPQASAFLCLWTLGRTGGSVQLQPIAMVKKETSMDNVVTVPVLDSEWWQNGTNL